MESGKFAPVQFLREGEKMRDITLCHPKLQKLAAKLIEECRQQGLIIKIGETLRTVKEQDALYAQGRTTPGNIVTNAPGSSYSSYHQWGTAFDIYRDDGQGAYNESDQFFEKVGKIGVSIGLEWGGNWKSIVDKPHFQLPDWGSTTAGIKKLYRSPDQFMKTWTREKEPEGWVLDANGWWYRNADGTWPANKWKEIDGKWYWFNESGYMECNAWKKDGEKWYYLTPLGHMAAGCIMAIGNEIYAFGDDGAMMEGKIELRTNERGALIL